MTCFLLATVVPVASTTILRVPKKSQLIRRLVKERAVKRETNVTIKLLQTRRLTLSLQKKCLVLYFYVLLF